MPIGVFAPAPLITWPNKLPDAVLDYTYDATLDLGPDTLQSVSASIAPSGTGELVASQLSFSGALMTIWLAGGVPGRSYIIKFIGICPSGRTYSWAIGITIAPALATFPLASPPNAGFGPAISHP